MWPFSTETIAGRPTVNEYAALHFRVNSGPGVSGLSEAASAHRDRIVGMFVEAERMLITALDRAGAIWEGPAADATDAGIRPMAGFSAEAADASNAAAAAVQNEAEHFSWAKNSMPPPVEVTATDNALERGWSHLWGNQTDKEIQEANAAAAEAEGYRVYGEYEAMSIGNLDAAGSYPTPPSTTFGVEDPTIDDNRGVGGNLRGPGVTAQQGTPGAGTPPAAPSPAAGSAPGPQGGSAPPPGGGLAPGPLSGTNPDFGASRGAGLAGQLGGGVPPRGGGAGGGAVMPGPFPLGAGGGADARERWRRTRGPGLFDNDPEGRRGGRIAGATGGPGRAAVADDGSERSRGKGAGERSATGRPGAAGIDDGPNSTRGGARGAAGTPGMVAPGAAGRRGEDDKEHQRPEYLVETEDIFGDGRKVVPPVIGEDPR